MSVSAAVFAAVYVACLVLAFRWPLIGLGGYLWAYYNHPPFRWWGEQLPDIRWSLVAAIVTFVACVIHLAARPSSAEDSGAPSGARSPFGTLDEPSDGPGPRGRRPSALR